MAEQRQARPVRQAVVVGTERLTRDMVRLRLGGEGVASLEPLAHTDSYVKLLFGDVTRTYTIRHLDTDAGEMTVDFLVHGDRGLAGPWARDAKVGDEIAFRGPGGAWHPRAGASGHLFVGDETAAPAIAAALDTLPHPARAVVVLQVADDSVHLPLRALPGLEVRWLHRDAGDDEQRVLESVASLELDWVDVEAFVHGNADMVRLVRRHLVGERGVPREHLSLSGYWRPGLDEPGWQSSKRDFVAQMDADLAREG